jgi:hypothetical protein
MKIIQEEVVPAFKPVSIVLESQAEVNYFASLLGGTVSTFDEAFGLTERDTCPIYYMLEQLADGDRPRAQNIKVREGY